MEPITVASLVSAVPKAQTLRLVRLQGCGNAENLKDQLANLRWPSRSGAEPCWPIWSAELWSCCEKRGGDGKWSFGGEGGIVTMASWLHMS